MHLPNKIKTCDDTKRSECPSLIEELFFSPCLIVNVMPCLWLTISRSSEGNKKTLENLEVSPFASSLSILKPKAFKCRVGIVKNNLSSKIKQKPGLVRGEKNILQQGRDCKGEISLQASRSVSSGSQAGHTGGV